MNSVAEARAVMEYARANTVMIANRETYLNFSRSKSINHVPRTGRVAGSDAHLYAPTGPGAALGVGGGAPGQGMPGMAPPMQPGAAGPGGALMSAPTAPGRDPGPQPPGCHTLMMSVRRPLYPITVDVIQAILAPYGGPVRVVIFLKNGIQALVELADEATAARIMAELQGKDIYDGCCTLHIEWGKQDRLTVKANNEVTRDFTNPALPTNSAREQLQAMAQINARTAAELAHGGGAGPAAAPGGMPGAMPGMPGGVPGMGAVPVAAASNPWEQAALDGGDYTRAMTVPDHPGIAKPQPLPPSLAPGQPRAVLSVGNLNPAYVTCESLFNLFSLYGNVQRIKLLPKQGDVGSAVVQLQDNLQADAAVASLAGTTLFGRPIDVQYCRDQFIPTSFGPSDPLPATDFAGSSHHRFRKPEHFKHLYRPQRTLHFSNAPPNWDEEAASAFFAEHGTKQPVQAKVFGKTTSTGRTYEKRCVPPGRARAPPLTATFPVRSAGLVEFDSEMSATEAVLLCNHSVVDGCTIKLAFSLNSLTSRSSGP